MRETASVLLIWFSLTTFATEQIPDRLIYQSDTIFIETFPLEKLMKSDSIIRERIFKYSEDICLSSDCWRGHVATWRIEKDSVFLVELTSGCEDYKFKLEHVFGIKKVIGGKVFASWFSGDLNAVFGKRLEFDVENWEYIYTKSFNCKVINGRIGNLEIREKPDCFTKQH